MIYDNNALNVLYKNYSNINQKISLEAKKGNITRIKRELYTNLKNFYKKSVKTIYILQKKCKI